MARDWLNLAVAGLALGGLLAGCMGVPTRNGTGGAPIGQAVTGCGGETITVPAGDAMPSPACSHGPMTTPSPFPISEASALAAGEAFLGRTGLQVESLSLGLPAYLLTGAGSGIVVDGSTGLVLQYIELPDGIGSPDGQVPDWSPAPLARATVRDAAAAIVAARAWLAKHGPVQTASDPAHATSDTLPGSNAWSVQLTRADGHPLSVRVAATGAVVGYQVDASPLPLALPRLGRDAAIAIALERARQLTGRADERLIGAEFVGLLTPDREIATWTIGTGIPLPDASTGGVMWSLGTAITVDVVTGEATVEKAP